MGGRYKASLVQDEHYLLTCMRYIELNPVRADIVKTPSHYKWSSYRYNAQAKANELITPHPLYTGLGKTTALRVTAYKALFQTHLDAESLSEIRAAWQTGTLLGNDYFLEKIEKKLKCKVGQARRGRPCKQTENIG